MIHIKSQDSLHQYDEFDNPITTWDDKKCAWIVEPEYEEEEIAWWGEDNDFPRGLTLKEFEEENPGWDKIPDISVTWTWSEDGYKKQFMDWYNYPLPVFPVICTRDWGYIDYSEEEAIEFLGKYCKWNIYSDKVEIKYNNKLIFSGKLV